MSRDHEGSLPFPRYEDLSQGLDIKECNGHGDISAEPLFLSVGQSLSIFERIQDEIVALFDCLCGGTGGSLSPMAKIIGATSSFNVKLDLCKQAAKTFLSNEKHQVAVERWLRLAQKASVVRNKIAHGQPVRANFMKDGISATGTFWAPSMYDTKSDSWPEVPINKWKYAWSSEQINEYSNVFHSVYAMLLTVREELTGKGNQETARVLDPSQM